MKKRKKSANFVSAQTNKKQISKKLKKGKRYPFLKAPFVINVSMKRATSQENLLLDEVKMQERLRKTMKKYNSITKVDLNGEIYQKKVFNRSIIVLGAKMPLKREKGKSVGKDIFKAEKDAKKRAKTKVRDYIKTNTDLEYFVTYTFSSKKIESRYDEKKIYAGIRDWLKKAVQRKGLKYVLVPELHKDGAWHFHGFTNMNLDWKYGFKVVSRITQNKERQIKINYITSYIGKGNMKFNGRRYLHSQNLQEPIKIYDNEDFETAKGTLVKIEGLEGVEMKVE